jgi:hypothetical protein
VTNTSRATGAAAAVPAASLADAYGLSSPLLALQHAHGIPSPPRSAQKSAGDQ